jgi:hypothetical protein
MFLIIDKLESCGRSGTQINNKAIRKFFRIDRGADVFLNIFDEKDREEIKKSHSTFSWSVEGAAEYLEKPLLNRIISRKGSKARTEKAAIKRETEGQIFKTEVTSAAHSLKNKMTGELMWGEIGLDAMTSRVSDKLGHDGTMLRRIKNILKDAGYPAKRTGISKKAT